MKTFCICIFVEKNLKNLFEQEQMNKMRTKSDAKKSVINNQKLSLLLNLCGIFDWNAFIQKLTAFFVEIKKI